MAITLLAIWFIRLPAAFALSSFLGSDGIWWSIPAGWAVGAALSTWYYRTGRWKSKALTEERRRSRRGSRLRRPYDPDLSGPPRRLRSVQYIFQGLNQLSFILLSGSLVTLYALRLGLPNRDRRALRLRLPDLLLHAPGARADRRMRIIDVFGWGWILRYLLMLPVLITPLLVSRGRPEAALFLVIFATAGFNVFRA